MDQRPIGIFDSGVGGLSAVRVLLDQAPEENIAYFGDTARVPYGNRSRAEITTLSLQDVRFLQSRKPKAILIACNTITASCLEDLRQANPATPILGVIEAAALAAAQATTNRRIGIMATQATVESGAYERALRAQIPDVKIFAKGCPGLVPLIEAGHICPGDAEIETAVAKYLEEIRQQRPDTLILGCTHYPLIRDVVQAYMGSDVTLIDSGGEAALALLDFLKQKAKTAPDNISGNPQYYCSARLAEFEDISQLFLRRDISASACQINIESY